MKSAGKWENCLGELFLSASFHCKYTANSGKSKILGRFQVFEDCGIDRLGWLCKVILMTIVTQFGFGSLFSKFKRGNQTQ